MCIQREFFQDEVGPLPDIVVAGCSLAEAIAALPRARATSSERRPWAIPRASCCALRPSTAACDLF
jgi:hypothetical protein